MGIRREEEPQEIELSRTDKVREQIRKVEVGIEPGCHLIFIGVLRRFARKAVEALSDINNAKLKLRCFPRKWKLADVIVLPQHGEIGTFPQDYLSIILLPAMSKVIEIIIAVRLHR